MAAHNSAFELQLIGGNPYVSIFSEDLNKTVGLFGGDENEEDEGYFSDEELNDNNESVDNPLSSIFGGDDILGDDATLSSDNLLKNIFDNTKIEDISENDEIGDILESDEEESEDEIRKMNETFIGGDDIEDVDDILLF